MSSSKLCSHFQSGIHYSTWRKWSAGLFNHFSPDSRCLPWDFVTWHKIEWKSKWTKSFSYFECSFVVIYAKTTRARCQKSIKNRVKGGMFDFGNTWSKAPRCLKAEVRHTIHQKTRPLSSAQPHLSPRKKTERVSSKSCFLFNPN